MKKTVLFSLILALVLSMTGCGCDHQWEAANCQAPKTCSLCGKTEGETGDHIPGELEVAAVDTENLTITHNLTCSICKAAIETKESTTGIAPVNGVMQLSPEEWFACLSTNIYQYGLNQTLVPFAAESEDDALVQAVITFSGLKAAYTFRDMEGNVITTEQKGQRRLVNSLYIEAQFTNDTASEFYQLLMVTAITNNSALTLEDADTLASQIMSFETVSDNGYTYTLEILSTEDHTVALTVTAE